jgi:hypothetical protein
MMKKVIDKRSLLESRDFPSKYSANQKVHFKTEAVAKALRHRLI